MTDNRRSLISLMYQVLRWGWLMTSFCHVSSRWRRRATWSPYRHQIESRGITTRRRRSGDVRQNWTFNLFLGRTAKGRRISERPLVASRLIYAMSIRCKLATIGKSIRQKGQTVQVALARHMSSLSALIVTTRMRARYHRRCCWSEGGPKFWPV